MAWKKEDQPSSIPVGICSRFGVENTRTNADRLYQNVLIGDLVPGKAVGIFLFDPNEVSSRPGASAGWNLREEGSGGRAGRVSYENLYTLSFEDFEFGLITLNSFEGTVSVPLDVFDSTNSEFLVSTTVLDSTGASFNV